MPLFEPFSHYLAYNATDQETFRELRDSYTGVLVPGTIAAWQRQGTGGFVLSLSATDQAPPYFIDPRFPLFQQGLVAPKQSHHTLAELFGDPTLVRELDPTPDLFSDDRLRQIAEQWVEFNTAYGSSSNEKFDKYAKRLGEDVAASDAQGPEAVLAPYFVCSGTQDAWWPRAKRLFEHTQVASPIDCLRVVCSPHAEPLDELLADVGDQERLIVWVSGLDEHNAPAYELRRYRVAIARAKQRGQELFGLYGGFFSVLLGMQGLSGAAHGVGFSEHRNWRELPQSGAPPARYYLPTAHRYVAQDLAQAMWEQDPSLTGCACQHCDGREPITLDYHELMKHSVYCRAAEINDWYQKPTAVSARDLIATHVAMTAKISNASLPPRIKARAHHSIEHLPVWADALISDDPA